MANFTVFICTISLFMMATLRASSALPVHTVDKRQTQSETNDFISSFESTFPSLTAGVPGTMGYFCEVTYIMKIAENLVSIKPHITPLNYYNNLYNM